VGDQGRVDLEGVAAGVPVLAVAEGGGQLRPAVDDEEDQQGVGS
jgi:hypothetical protein